MNRLLWCILGVGVALGTAPIFSNGEGLSGAVVICTTSGLNQVHCPGSTGFCREYYDECITDHGWAANTCGTSQAAFNGCAANFTWCGWTPNQILNTNPPCAPQDLGC